MGTWSNPRILDNSFGAQVCCALRGITRSGSKAVETLPKKLNSVRVMGRGGGGAISWRSGKQPKLMYAFESTQIRSNVWYTMRV